MKKLGKLILVLLLCFSVVGCGSKSTEEKFKDAGYTIKYNKDEYTTVTISESKDGKGRSQFIAYVDDKKIESIAFIQLPKDAKSYDDMLIGYIYTDKKSSSEVDKKVEKAAEKLLDKLDLTIDDLKEYTFEVQADKGKSLKD